MSELIAHFAKVDGGFRLALVLYLLAFAASLAALFLPDRKDPKGLASQATVGLFAAGWLANAGFLVLRGLEAGRPPFKTFFESLAYFAALLGLLALATARIRRVRLLACAALGIILTALAVALLKADLEVVDVPPALNSAWFLPHVTVYFAGYASVSVAAVFSALGLLRPGLRRVAEGGFWHRALGEQALDFSELSRRWTRIGFLLLSAGLLSGALWAKFAWSDYWAWDPKESWGLLTWLVYGAVLHMQHAKAWRGRPALTTGLFAWGLLAFTFFGMHLLPTRSQSLHVYTDAPRP